MRQSLQLVRPLKGKFSNPDTINRAIARRKTQIGILEKQILLLESLKKKKK